MASGENRTRTMVNMWRNVGHLSNLSLSWTKREMRGRRAHSCGFTGEREEKMEKGEPSFLPRSTKFRWLVFVEPRTKVHRIHERYAWVLEKRDFTKDLNGEISGN